MKGFQSAITIKEAIDKIVSREFLIPAIQRKFVWKSYQIETLFDSIMRGYPINSFMFWEIRSSNVKNAFKFYQFLTSYREFFKEDNDEIDTKGFKKFYAIIDGQQRLTSLYLGLKGSYAYKMPRKWWKNDEESLPTRQLYLNISHKSTDQERQTEYDFRFLTETEVGSDNVNQWFKVNDILKFDTVEELWDFLYHSASIFKNSKFARECLLKLRKCIFEEKVINYYLEDNQNIDVVLDIFIRTNSGGQPLSFSNLLMSITTANWTRLDARNSFDNLIKQVFDLGKPGFKINADLILKICLFLFNDSLKFKVKNFDRSSVQAFEDNWENISKAIVETFKLLESWGFNDSSLRAKNAVIPIVYFIYKNHIIKDINNPIKYKTEKVKIRQWLCISILKGIFGGQSDEVLTKTRKVLERHDDGSFPLEEIKDAFKDDPSKNLSFSDDFVDGLLTVQKENSDCYIVLSLLYSHLNFNQELHMDHLHPYSYFHNLKQGSMSDEDYAFFKDPANYNSVANLQLLNGSENESKNAKPLDQWVKENKIDLKNQLIPEDVSLEVADFKEFIEKRKQLLKAKLLQITGRDTANQDQSISGKNDDQTQSISGGNNNPPIMFGGNDIVSPEFMDEIREREGYPPRTETPEEHREKIGKFLHENANTSPVFAKLAKIFDEASKRSNDKK